jgi:hypothetical protein
VRSTRLYVFVIPPTFVIVARIVRIAYNVIAHSQSNHDHATSQRDVTHDHDSTSLSRRKCTITRRA